MISAIVLAAGKSARMGKVNKMLLPYKASIVIGTVVAALVNSLVDEIIIVENQDASIAEHLDNNAKVKFVINKDADQGLTSSIQCGVKTASNNSTGYLICLGDMPLITNIDYNLLINKLLSINHKVILMPIHNKKRGNPVLFSASFKEDILLLQDNSGCKPVVTANNDFVTEVPFPNNNCHVDIDTMADYKRMISQ